MYYSSSAIATLVNGGAFIFSSMILPGEASASWEDLKLNLSTEATLHISSFDNWYDQCLDPFADLNLSLTSGLCVTDGSIDCQISRYQLINQTSGLCMGNVLCAYEECDNVGDRTWFGNIIWTQTFDSTLYPKQTWQSFDDRLNLPEAVVHPIHVGDISAAVKYAAEHKIEISVKTSGHSYTGSSTKKNTLMLNLYKLQKYSSTGSPIVECQIDPSIKEGAFQDACNFAIARNKPGVIRVGGGEIWDEAYHALYVTWNENKNNTRKYHVLGGATATVSAAGGWLASGGLSANGNMRSYGLGVDQVLHVEMVLPSGRHVRFGPTEWKKEDDKMYPVTTHVKGYCNMGDLSDEDLWVWQECKDDIDFPGLWFAVRGGGGGSYGVITSIYYQLHNYSPLDVVEVSDPFEEQEEVAQKWIEFVLRFFYLPESVGVTEAASHSCSTPDDGGFKGAEFLCFNGAGSIMKGAWERFFSDDALDVGVETKPSWAHYMVNEGKYNTNVPEGRAKDGYPPALYSTFGTFSSPNKEPIVNEYMVFPIEVIVKKLDHMVDIFYECIKAGACFGNMYIMGGKISSTDDGMNALPIHRRHAAFLTVVTDIEWRTKFKQIIYGVGEGEPFVGDSFPGEICHNHASANFPTALKKDWTQACNPSWEDEMKEEKCLSFHEASWGTDVLMKLQDIHAAVDPDNLFNCWDCVGNSPDIKKGKKKKKNKKKTKQTKIEKKMKKKYPKCNPDNWNLIGDGNCDPSYNTEECGHDDGDCN